MNNIRDVVKNHLCLGCGFCRFEDGSGEMVFSEKQGQYLPGSSKSAGEGRSAELTVCPGKGYSIVGRAAELYAKDSQYNLDLGYVYKTYAAHSNSETVLKNASSGGMITELALFLLARNIVDRVVVTKFIYTPEGVRTKTTLTDSAGDILEAQGSKYCPVNISEALKAIKLFSGKIAFIGTPCLIAGIRALQKDSETFRKKTIITIGNFCGGYKDYNNIKQLAKLNGIDTNRITHFRFRGGGQPGSLVISDVSGKTARIPYPDYVGYTGYSRQLRCRLCVDATGELADFACGDAWLPRFENSSSPWSIVIARNALASSVIEQMIEDKLITSAPVSLQETIASQELNIWSTKHRQASRMSFYKMLGHQVPVFDGGYRKKRTGLRTELAVYTKHKLTLFLEKIGLYYKAYHLIKLRNKEPR